jgi:enoyl-CoA hydratase
MLLLAGWAKRQDVDFTNMSHKNLVVTREEPGICIVKISRPKALNALNTETLHEMKTVLTQEMSNPKTRVLLLAGDGEKAFIAGADIAEMKDKDTGEGIGFSQLGHDVAKLLETMPKPTIAVVNGFALGGGTEMAIACDFIIASDKAVFGQPEVGLGVIPGFGATFRLSKFVGIPMAKELIFSGRKIKADEAKEIGLVNHIFPADQLMTKAIEIAKSISTQSHTAVSKAKKLINEFAESNGLTFKLDAEAHAFGRLFGTHDQKEGMTAFVDKRKPAFEGL